MRLVGRVRRWTGEVQVGQSGFESSLVIVMAESYIARATYKSTNRTRAMTMVHARIGGTIDTWAPGNMGLAPGQILGAIPSHKSFFLHSNGGVAFIDRVAIDGPINHQGTITWLVVMMVA